MIKETGMLAQGLGVMKGAALFEIDIHIVLDIYLPSRVLREFMIKEGETIERKCRPRSF